VLGCVALGISGRGRQGYLDGFSKKRCKSELKEPKKGRGGEMRKAQREISCHLDRITKKKGGAVKINLGTLQYLGIQQKKAKGVGSTPTIKKVGFAPSEESRGIRNEGKKK